MKVLIPGISTAIGMRVARMLLGDGHEVIGIDRRPWADAPAGVQMHQMDIRKRAAEEVFRSSRPDAVIHMATVTHLSERSPDRYRINLMGTRAVFKHCKAYGVQQMIFVGRHTYYGAASDSPLYHTEDEPPMAIESFPELADLVAADLYAGSALWRLPEVTTAVLRMSYSLGPSGHGTLGTFLRGRVVPMVLGFDPLFQFIHEEDHARAICMALHKGLRGIFNVPGLPPVPLSVIIRETGRIAAPVPEKLFALLLGRFGLPRLSRGAIHHIKYPVVMDGSTFQAETGFKPKMDEAETLGEFRAAFPPRKTVSRPANVA